MRWLETLISGVDWKQNFPRFASKWARFPVADILKRTRYTTQQAQLDRKERLENLRDAFALGNPQRAAQAFTGKNLLRVDDVFTIGTTVNECARNSASASAAATRHICRQLRTKCGKDRL